MIDKNLQTISCVIPTYNRCPHRDRVELNPPWWAANSLAKQKNVGEIIFVDDASEDYTEETIARIIEKTQIPILFLRNDENIGCGKSRTKGVDAARYDKIWFMDDDCIVVDKDVLLKLEFSFDFLRQRRRKVGALTLPVSGDSLESKLVSMEEIGRVDREKGVMLGCYTKFPINYLESPDRFYIDREREIFLPLQVELMGGVFLCSKQAYQETGGFPTTPWRNACAEEPHLMMTMQQLGYDVFYSPSLNPQFRVFHCRYGDSDYKRAPYNIEIDDVSFNEILQESSRVIKGTGNRVSKEEEAYSGILSDMVFMFRFFGKEVGFNNLRTKYSVFMDRKIFPDVERREEVFWRAIRDGAEILGNGNIT